MIGLLARASLPGATCKPRAKQLGGGETSLACRLAVAGDPQATVTLFFRDEALWQVEAWLTFHDDTAAMGALGGLFLKYGGDAPAPLAQGQEASFAWDAEGIAGIAKHANDVVPSWYFRLEYRDVARVAKDDADAAKAAEDAAKHAAEGL